MDTIRAALTRTYDLSYRPEIGSSHYYVMDIVYRHAAAGEASHVENYRGAFRRTATETYADAVTETVTWTQIGRREAASVEELSEWQRLEWADGFTYEFNAEDSYENYHWSYDRFPRDDENWALSWNVALLTLDAHFEFDFLRSRRHGAIDRLRRIGDSVLAPDSDQPFWLGLPPVVDVPAFTKRGLRSTFLGLGLVGDQSCAVLSFAMDPSPFAMTVAGTSFEVSSIFRGTIHVRLTDGSLEQGEFDECVIGGNGPVYPRYTIRRVEPAVWERGALDVNFTEINQ